MKLLPSIISILNPFFDMTSLEMITAFVDTSYVLSKESKTFHSSAPRALKERNTFYKSSLCHSFVLLLNVWSRVLLEKLTSSQLVKFPHCMEPEYSLPCPQVPLPILSQINPVHAPSSHSLKIHLKFILPSMPWSSKWSISLKFPHQNPVCTPALAHTCHISFSI